MDRHIIVYVSSPTDTESSQNKIESTISHYLGSVLERTSDNLSAARKCHLLLHGVDGISSGATAEQTNETAAWKEIEVSCVENVPSLKLKDQSSEHQFESSDVADQLLDYTETLPKLGTTVDIILFFTADSKPISEQIELFGSFKCLASWYNASTTVVSLAHDPNNICKQWANLLGGRSFQMNEICKIDKNFVPVWRGFVHLNCAQVDSSMKLGGFALYKRTTHKPALTFNAAEFNASKESQLILTSEMEFLGEVIFYHIPSYYLSDRVYNLGVFSESTKHSRSNKFLERLQSNVDTGYMLRIKAGGTWKQTEDKNVGPGKEDKPKGWQDYILEDTNFAEEYPLTTELTGTRGHYTFLAYYHHETNEYVAHLLRKPNQLNGYVMDAIAMSGLNQTISANGDLSKNISAKDTSNIHETINGLPHLSAATFIEINKNVERLQAHVLQEWIDHQGAQSNDSMTISASDLDFLLSNTRQTYITHLQDAGLFGKTRSHGQAGRVDHPLEWERDPYLQPERIVLSNKQKIKSKFTRFKSSDSLGGLSPPCAQNKVVMLDAAEFLRCFKTDGTAVKDSLTQVSVKNNAPKHTSCTLEEAKSAEWPSCESFQFHGIHYHGKLRVDDIEKKGIRLKNKLNNIDTCSTCTSRQVGSPASISVVSDKLEEKPRKPLSGKSDNPDDSAAPARPKRRAPPLERVVEDSKRLYDHAKKRKLEEDQKKKLSKEEKESRSQRHRRRLEIVVNETLIENDVDKKNPIYKSCFQRLYKLTESLCKTLKSSVNLREQMKSLANEQAAMVVLFERSQKKS